MKRPANIDGIRTSNPECKTPREIALAIAEEFGCNCDLDNWEPEPISGHTHVCRIHKLTMREMANRARHAMPNRGGEA